MKTKGANIKLISNKVKFDLRLLLAGDIFTINFVNPPHFYEIITISSCYS